MPVLEIIGVPQSNYVWAVRMVCEEKGVAYDYKPERPHSPAVDAIHPFGKVPVMRHGDLELCESKAIATYIDRVFDGPKVIPDDAKRAAQVEILDRAVAGTGHLVGDSLTLADINILPMLFYVNRFEEGKAMLGAAKNLSAYMERHFARPSFKASAPPPPKK